MKQLSSVDAFQLEALEGRPQIVCVWQLAFRIEGQDLKLYNPVSYTLDKQ